MERAVAQNSSMVVRARNAGTVTSVDGNHIVLNGTDEYKLLKYVGLNERTCLNQTPIVKLGEKVKKSQIIADGGGTCDGVLSLGRNVLVAFVPYDGYNFEDAILISERLVKDDVFTSIHIDQFSVEIRETKLGREEFTRDIPNVSEKALRNLDEDGIVREGTRVAAGDILVGKVSPKSKTELTPEEKLLHAIFGRAGEDVKNDSLEAPSGFEGVVIGTRRFMRRGAGSEEQRQTHKQDMQRYEVQMVTRECQLFKRMMEDIHGTVGVEVVDPSTRQRVGASDEEDVLHEQIENFDIAWVKPAKLRDDVQKIVDRYWPKLEELQEEKVRRMERMKHGDELPSGVLEMVKIYIATKRTLSIGDKMAGRHGNKGVIAKIMPEEDMPFLEDGTPMDVCLNPLGVPSRMNVGQILETHLGWAAKILGFDCVTPVFDGATEEQIWAVTDEANAHVQRRIADLEGKKIVESIDDAKEFIRDALEYQFVTIDKSKMDRASLEKVEAILMPKFPYSAAHAMPRFNNQSKPNEPLSVAEKRLVGECVRVIREEPVWYRDPKDAPSDKAGIYFFRDIENRSVKRGYIGMTDRADGLRGRLTSHYDQKDDNLLVSIAKKEPAFVKQALCSAKQVPPSDELFTVIPRDLKATIYDGRTGEPLEQEATIGYIYMMKLHHLVDDKIHARATGPYSLITQQPLGGKARTGGQRFGEMEVWALEAYGAAYTLQELLTVKSDDIEGRTKIYESMVKGDNTLEAGTPISFDVLCNEIRGLGLNIQLAKKRIGLAGL
jgi:DNA-directed RNA polymerase beta subunit